MSGLKNETMSGQEYYFEIKIEDSRTIKDLDFPRDLSERIITDKVHEALIKARKFFGEYAAANPQDLTVNLVDGTFGEGTIKKTSIEVQVPSIEALFSNTRAFLEPMLEDASKEEKDKLTKQLVLATTASTILHEGSHGLLNSRPDSKFASDMEQILGIENTNGKFSTLLDEGIAYAIQEIYAPEIKPIGSLAPRINEDDREIVKWRKRLGQKLRPTVEKYTILGKSIDKEFFKEASHSLYEILLNQE